MKMVDNVLDVIHRGRVLQKELEIPLNEQTVRMIIVALAYKDNKYIVRICETHYPHEGDYLESGFDKNEIIEFYSFQEVEAYLEPFGGVQGLHAAKGLKFL